MANVKKNGGLTEEKAAAVRKAATDGYASDDIDFETDAQLDRPKDESGTWVAAWIWVPDNHVKGMS